MKGQIKRNPLPPPPRERGVSPPVSPRPPPPPVSKEKGFDLNVYEKPMTSEALLSRIPSISNSNSNPEFISRAPSMSNSNAEQDPFFISAKNYAIKKLELEVLKEELESAKYEETLKTPEYSKIYPKLENIYKKHKKFGFVKKKNY
jgi:hypothetical protein